MGDHTGAVIVVGILLTLTVATGTVIFGAHSTILDPGFVTNAIDEEDGYEALTVEMERAIDNATAGANATESMGGDFDTIIEQDPIAAGVTPEYVRGQVESNVKGVYRYLHGKDPVLNLTLDTRPVAEGIGLPVAGSIENATIAELVAAAPGEPFDDAPVDEAMVARLNEGSEAYDGARRDFRDRVRAQVVDTFVDRAYETRDEDELLALVITDYDPDAYSEAEKERMVTEREREIREALHPVVEDESGAAIEESTSDQIRTYRTESVGSQPSVEAVGNASVAAAVGDLQDAVVVGLTGEQSYEVYRADAERARADLGTTAGRYLAGEFVAQAGIVDLNEELSIERRGAFATPKTVVGAADLAAIVLPILALLAVGLVWFLSKSIAVTAATVGASLVVGALPALIGAPMLADPIRSTVDLDGETASAMEALVTGVLDRVVGTITAQSLVLIVVGMALLGLALSLRYGLRERIERYRHAE